MSGLDAAFVGRRGKFQLEAEISAPSGAVTALFGPSGAGKTTLMRAIAGLDRLAGRCRLDETVWQDDGVFLPSHRRAIGYVFQEASLFPHLSVRRNLAYGMRRASGANVAEFDDTVELLGLVPLLDRAPAMLSGGERQRVALGRALLSQPKLLLLDEPLSGLDRAAKDEILPYLEALLRRVNLPVLLVTHDIGEVERLADRLILLRQGRVAGAGPLSEMLVGRGFGFSQARDAAAILAGTVKEYAAADGLSVIDVGAASMLVVGRAGEVGAKVRLRIAARDVSLALDRPSRTSILNVLPVRVVSIDPVGEAEAVTTLAIGDQRMLARLTLRSVRELALQPGSEAFAQLKGVSLVAGGR
jgi:molybdate transport system ATP-binding protein